MTVLLSLTTERRSETRLIADTGRSLLYCNTNIMKYTSLRILMARNSTTYDQENEVCNWVEVVSVKNPYVKPVTTSTISDYMFC